MNPLELKHRVGLIETVRRTFAEALDRAADAIKEELLDLGMRDDPTPPAPEAVELPPLSTCEFVAALRDKVEMALAEVAAVINEAPAGHVVEASEERVRELLTELWCEALETGLQMRIDAAYAYRPIAERGQGKWAEKFRRMRTGEPVFPYPKDAITGKHAWLKDLSTPGE